MCVLSGVSICAVALQPCLESLDAIVCVCMRVCVFSVGDNSFPSMLC